MLATMSLRGHRAVARDTNAGDGQATPLFDMKDDRRVAAVGEGRLRRDSCEVVAVCLVDRIDVLDDQRDRRRVDRTTENEVDLLLDGRRRDGGGADDIGGLEQGPLDDADQENRLGGRRLREDALDGDVVELAAGEDVARSARCNIGEFSWVPGVIPASSRIVVLATRLLPSTAIESGVAHFASAGAPCEGGTSPRKRKRVRRPRVCA